MRLLVMRRFPVVALAHLVVRQEEEWCDVRGVLRRILTQRAEGEEATQRTGEDLDTTDELASDGLVHRRQRAWRTQGFKEVGPLGDDLHLQLLPLLFRVVCIGMMAPYHVEIVVAGRFGEARKGRQERS